MEVQISFLVMPIAVTLWYMTMDIAVMIAGGDISWELRKLVSLYTGLLMIGLAFWVDIRSRDTADYAFWIYIFGALVFGAVYPLWSRTVNCQNLFISA